jgi:hypothetical protein|tara:strand:- start:469 stop:642 length:174 start_codon:yes stop_codon:yes gene_type:complete
MKRITNSFEFELLDCLVLVNALVHYASDLQITNGKEGGRVVELIDQLNKIREDIKNG